MAAMLNNGQKGLMCTTIPCRVSALLVLKNQKDVTGELILF